MLTDSHCHLASHRFDAAEVPALIARSRAAGVTRLVTLATCLEDIAPNLAFADDPAVHTCIGIHPCDVHNAPDDAVEKIAAFVSDSRVCGIGETGLDYYHPAPDGWGESAFRERQHTFLHQHFRLAVECGLNVVIHTRDQEGHASFDDALAIYAEYHKQTRAVLHCFIGTPENAARVFALGGIVSFGGVSTFKSAKQVRETILSCPEGSFMLETDAPYLAPEPHRGKRNEPSYVSHTADFIAKLRGEGMARLADHTTRTALEFFRLRANG